MILPPVRFRPRDGDRAGPGHHLALGQRPVAHRAGPAIFRDVACMRLGKRRRFRLDDPPDRATRPGSRQIGRGIRRKTRWIGEGGDYEVRLGGIFFSR